VRLAETLEAKQVSISGGDGSAWADLPEAAVKSSGCITEPLPKGRKGKTAQWAETELKRIPIILKHSLHA
jgi:hypothetical protein